MTILRNKILKHTYNDSIVLMQHTVELESMPGVTKAAIMMGTPAILQYLKEENFLVGVDKNISADDMVIAAEGRSEAEVDMAIAAIIKKLTGQDKVAGQPTTSDDRLAKDAGQLLWRDIPKDVRLSLISVPGRYAAAEALRAIKNGNHVMLFSNNVSLEDELALKNAAKERNLLVMGPDCGTAIINGVPLGFSNRVRQGNIGIIAGAGSGLQELTCLIDRMGYGISHAIGTGGRDLSAEVGGITTAMGLEFLKNDQTTDLILLLSKPPNPQVASNILMEVKEAGKPVAICFIGYKFEEQRDGNVYFTSTIAELAEMAIALADPSTATVEGNGQKVIRAVADDSSSYIRGFFSGGTLAYETLYLLGKYFGKIFSNISKNSEFVCKLDDLADQKHIILDLGTEEFTTGRPHPMIDGRWRADLVKQAGQNKYVKVIMFDLILGLGADPDPASAIIESIREARDSARNQGRELVFIASVVGTENDPQQYSAQCRKLKEEGVIIAATNAAASQLVMQKLNTLS